MSAVSVTQDSLDQTATPALLLRWVNHDLFYILVSKTEKNDELIIDAYSVLLSCRRL